MDTTPKQTTSVRVPKEVYDILVRHAEKTGRTLQYLLAKAILRCYAKDNQNAGV
jgi:predicted DNA-binding protein